jgi:hypothetical protein
MSPEDPPVSVVSSQSLGWSDQPGRPVGEWGVTHAGVGG